MSWTRDDVIRWLNDHPLPADFMWNGMIVQPRYHVTGYGKWLFESGPYYKALRGLPQLITEMIQEIVSRGIAPPDGAELAALLDAEANKQAALPLFEDVTEPTQKKPSDNPAETQIKPQAKPNAFPDLSQP